MKITIYSIMPCLNAEIGHIYGYHHSLAEAAVLNGWKHIGVVPKICSIKSFSKHWLQLFAHDPWDANKRFLFRIMTAMKNTLPFITLFKRIKRDPKTKSILFIEHGLHHLLGCISALFITKPEIEIWILHRYDYKEQKFRAKMYHIFHQILKWKLGNTRVKLLTDSELLVKIQTQLFCSKIHLLSIPHTSSQKCYQSKKSNSELLLWWPGGSIRVDKGLKDIQTLANHLTPNMTLILASKAKPLFTNHVHINFIESALTRAEYEKWMRRVDFVLLPYLPKIYHSSTSGIFVEAIIAGSIPITTQGTWMAYELKKYHLTELILNWDEPIVNLLNTLKDDNRIQKKLQDMQHCYQEFHSIQGFASLMRKAISS